MEEESGELSDGEIYTPERVSQSLENETDPSEVDPVNDTNVQNLESETAEITADISSPNVKNKSVLSKHQAKSRLKAFSLLKQNYLVASSSKKLLSKPESGHSKEDSDGGKKDIVKSVKKPLLKSSTHSEKAKAVIEEIESIKRQYYQEAITKIEASIIPKSRSRSEERRGNKQSSSYSRSYNYDKPQNEDVYPKNWKDFHERGMDFGRIRDMNSKLRSKKRYNDCYDFRRQLLFRNPVLLNPLRVKTISGSESLVPPQFIRYTTKKPSVSYSVNHIKNKEVYPTRKDVFREISRAAQSALNKFIHNTKLLKFDYPAKTNSRKWYPKTLLCQLDSSNECEILEPSLGLSFLQNYSDAEDEEKEETQPIVPEDEAAKTPLLESTQDNCDNDNKISTPIVENIENKNLPTDHEAIKDMDSETSTKEDKPKKKTPKKNIKKDKKKKKELLEKKKALKKKKLKRKLKKQKQDKLKKKSKKDKGGASDTSKNIKKRRRKSSDGSSRSESDCDTKEKRIKPSSKKSGKKIKLTDKSDVKTSSKEEKPSTRSRNIVDQNELKSDNKVKSKNKFHDRKPEKIYQQKNEKSKDGDLIINKSERYSYSRSRSRDADSNKSFKEYEIKKSIEKMHLDKKKFEFEDEIMNSKDNLKSEPLKNINFEKFPKPDKESEDEGGTPDTDEYHSRWESEDDISLSLDSESKSNREVLNHSWESDEEMDGYGQSKNSELITNCTTDRDQPKKLLSERSLEMPLNIRFFTSRSFSSSTDRSTGAGKGQEELWTNNDYVPSEASLEIRKLIRERENLNEERRLLEIEKKKLAEREKRKLECAKANDDKIVENYVSDNLEKVADDVGKNKKLDEKLHDKTDSQTRSADQLSLLESNSNGSEVQIKDGIIEVEGRKVPSVKIKVERVSDDDQEVAVVNTSSVPSSNEKSLCVLETEYEEFMRAVSENIIKQEEAADSKGSKQEIKRIESRKRKFSSSSSSSDSSGSSSSDSSSSTSSSSSSGDSKKRKTKRKVKEPVPVPPPTSLDSNVVPENLKDIMSPISKIADSTTSPLKKINLVPMKYLVDGQEPTSEPFIPLQNLENVIAEASNVENEVELDDKCENTIKKKITFSTIALPSKRQILDTSVFSSDDDDDKHALNDKPLEENQKENLEENSAPNIPVVNVKERPFSIALDSTPEKPKEKPQEKITEQKCDNRPSNETTSKPSSKRTDHSPKRYRRDYSPRRSRNVSPRKDSPQRRGRDSPPRRAHSPRHNRNDSRKRPFSPNRRDISPRRRPSPRRNQRRYDDSPKGRNISPRHKERPNSPRYDRSSPKYPDRRDRESPLRRRTDKLSSPKRVSPSRKSYTRDRSLSPPNDHRKPHHSPMVENNKQSIQTTLQRLAGIEEYRPSKSPINSPLEGLKRSLADSTISDDQLLEQSIDDYADSPNYATTNLTKFKRVESCSSPRRISLDDRINQVLGIDKEAPKPAPTQYIQTYQYNQYYDSYNNYTNVPPYHQPVPPRVVGPEMGKSKVLQVGNVLEVVPTEDIPTARIIPQEINTTQKILQVGNMLQIVPTATIDVAVPPPIIEPPPVIPPPVAVVVNEKISVETVMKQKSAEREKRRLAREIRRKEKEKKRKDKEKRKQMKMKANADMIKKALLLETEGAASLGREENPEGEEDVPIHWPPIPIVVSCAMKPPGKGILISHGFSNLIREGATSKKSVKFADGVCPGEGTSPSGGEELSSPPPQPVKLPKEKRYTKTKKPKRVKAPKKKVKVKVVKNVATEEDVDDEEDNLPPPSPPPGSPPIHLFPPRVKTHNINNIHPNYSPALPAIPPTALNMVPPYRMTMPPTGIPPPVSHSVPAQSLSQPIPTQMHVPPPLPMNGTNVMQFSTPPPSTQSPQIRHAMPVINHQNSQNALVHGHHPGNQHFG